MFKGIVISVIGAAAYGFISLFTKNLEIGRASCRERV